MGETKLLSECSDNPFGDGVIEVVMKLPYCGVRRETHTVWCFATLKASKKLRSKESNRA